MLAYDGDLFSPPAPLAKVSLRNLESGAAVSDVAMLLDTGADVTLLPRPSVERLGISIDRDESYELRGFDGSVSVASVVQADLLFLRRAFKGRFLLIDQEWELLGKDILNHVSLTFDGQRLVWEEQSRSGEQGTSNCLQPTEEILEFPNKSACLKNSHRGTAGTEKRD